MTQCPPWCIADHATEDEPGAVRHRGETFIVPVMLEGLGHGGAHSGELLVEVSRRHGEAAVWVYLGDGWTGFALSLESASRLSASLTAALRAAGTLDQSGL
jgi:hypothetical protein